jgi:hypothetical protein
MTFCSATAKNLASFPGKPEEVAAVTKPPTSWATATPRNV